MTGLEKARTDPHISSFSGGCLAASPHLVLFPAEEASPTPAQGQQCGRHREGLSTLSRCPHSAAGACTHIIAFLALLVGACVRSSLIVAWSGRACVGLWVVVSWLFSVSARCKVYHRYASSETLERVVRLR